MRVPASLIRRLVRLILWARDWRPLNFNWRWLPDPWRLNDDACDCPACADRRAKGTQGPQKYF